MKLKDMTKQERSLLLFFESGSAEHGGVLEGRCMNEEDFALAARWAKEGFIQFGRLTYKDCTFSKKHGGHKTHWVILSEEAWSLAQQERRERCGRLYAKRWWTTTEEKQAEKVPA